jgi:uncharacterized protein DUF4349
MMNRLASLTCVLLLGGGLLAGCGAAGDSESSSSGAAPAADSGKAGGEAAAVKPADVAKAASAAAPANMTRLVRTAEITVEVKDVAAAARSVRTTAVTIGGIVSTENTRLPKDSGSDSSSDAARDEQAEITLRVPEPKMDEALTKVAGTGRELNRSTTSDDVTATIVDLDSRVATQTKSVARVRNLLDQASSLQDVVLLESELARRESDLESIQARQRALVDKAALATVNVTLRATGAAADEPEEAGFLTGLDNGWTALKASTTVVLTVLGALLPVGLVLAVIGIPIYLVRRRLQPATPNQAPPAGPGGPPEPAPVPFP